MIAVQSQKREPDEVLEVDEQLAQVRRHELRVVHDVQQRPDACVGHGDDLVRVGEGEGEGGHVIANTEAWLQTDAVHNDHECGQTHAP